MKELKRSLAACLISVVLCLGLLVGTSFAWFTDSITNKGNTISAGTLKIELSEESRETLFTSDRVWSPGMEPVRTGVTVQNVGALPLRYGVSVTIVKETGGSEGALLSEKLNVYITPVGEAISTANFAGTLSDLAKETAVGKDNLLAVAATASFDIVIELPSAAGDEYQGASVEFDVAIDAVQA